MVEYGLEMLSHFAKFIINIAHLYKSGRSRDSCDAAGEISRRKKNRWRIHRSPTENYTARLSFGFGPLSCYADKRIDNIMKVYIERNNFPSRLNMIPYKI